MNAEVAGQILVASSVIDRHRESRHLQIVGPSKGMAVEVKPVVIDGRDWAWRTTKWPAKVESEVEDRSLSYACGA
ncbi:hypothetical protein M0R45_005036 [Rubus argutus]|uniref:Uncharacterized protein n=1 Tax=Rubus argutus TaxID=59490 RepID=A0AAW1YLG9_RUBAR